MELSKSTFKIDQQVSFPVKGKKLRADGTVEGFKNGKITVRYGRENKSKEFLEEELRLIETELSWNEEHSEDLILEDGIPTKWKYCPGDAPYFEVFGEINKEGYLRQEIPLNLYKKGDLRQFIKNSANLERASTLTIFSEPTPQTTETEWNPGDRLIVKLDKQVFAGTLHHDSQGNPWIRYTTGVSSPFRDVKGKITLDPIQWKAGDKFEWTTGKGTEVWTVGEKDDNGIRAEGPEGKKWTILTWRDLATCKPLNPPLDKEETTAIKEAETEITSVEDESDEVISTAKVSVVEPEQQTVEINEEPENLYTSEKRLRQLADDIKVRMKRTAVDVYHIGANLLEAKELLPHGEFLPWLKVEFDMAERTAQNFMRVAEVFQGKSANFADLNIATSALYQLTAPSKTSPEAIEEALERAEAGETVTSEMAKEILQKHPPTKPPRQQRESANTSLEGKGRSLGLSGGGAQQLPDTQQNDATPPSAAETPSPWSVTSSFTFELLDGTPIIGKYLPGENGNPPILTLTGEITKNANGSISKIVSAADRDEYEVPIHCARIFADLARRSYLAELNAHTEVSAPVENLSRPVNEEPEQPKHFVDWHTAWVSNLEEMPDDLLIAALEEVAQRGVKGRSVETLRKLHLAAQNLQEAVTKSFDKLLGQVEVVEANLEVEVKQEDLRFASELEEEMS